MENMPSLPGRWESPLQPVPASGSLNVVVSHGRGQPPRQVRWVAVCQKAELGYLPGDETHLYAYAVAGLPTPWANAAQLGLLIDTSNGGLSVVNRSTGTTATITAANWKLKCYADF